MLKRIRTLPIWQTYVPTPAPAALGKKQEEKDGKILEGTRGGSGGMGCRGKQAWLNLKNILHVCEELRNSLARLVGIGLSV